MVVLVTGVNGQLGYDAARELLARGHRVIGSGSAEKAKAAFAAGGSRGAVKTGTDGTVPETGFVYAQMDITVREEVDRLMERIRPDAVVHCAAWTAVDAAEEPENYGRVMAVNAEGTGYIAEACRRYDSVLMYISTDYVFDGQGTEPWRADSGDFAPLNVYGRSKLAGERAVKELLNRYFIVRIAWVFGINGGNFIKTMLKLGENHSSLRVVNDQIGTPTYTPDLARLLADMLETDRYGTYHATNEGGYISWYDLAVEIFRRSGQAVRVVPVTTEEYGASKAARPFNSRLDRSRLREQGFEPLPDWKDALDRYMRELRQDVE